MLLLSGCGGPPAAPSDAITAFELALSPATVAAGSATQGIVTLPVRASHDFYIQLASSDAVALIPSSIVVPSGSMSTGFTVATRLVAADTVARITATAGTFKQEMALQVLAPVARPATLDALELDAIAVRGGQNAQGTIRLTGLAPAPGGLSVIVRSSNAAAIVPATVVVPPGARTATFTASTRPVSLETELEITAAYSDQTRTVTLRIQR